MIKLLKAIILFLSIFIAATLAVCAAAPQFAGVQSLQAHQGPVPPIDTGYGSWGNHTVVTNSFQMTSQGYSNTVIIYYPTGQTTPAPTLFFAPGWNIYCRSYAELFHFWVSKGYVAVCDDYHENSGAIGGQLYDAFSEAAGRYSTHIDTDKIGLMGHSAGAGLLPSLAYKLVKNKGWGGANGQNTFIFSSAPWIDFDMTDAIVADYPVGVKWIMHTYEDDKGTDLRTYIEPFESLPIPDSEKDYITLRATTINTYTYQANHPVIATGAGDYGAFDAMDDYGVFRLVDALADYTFTGNASAKNVALGDGSDKQIEMGDLRDLISTDDPRPIPGETYDYPCDISDNPRRAHCADYDSELPATTLISPTKRITVAVASPIFQWEPVATANRYALQVRPLLPTGEPDWTISYGENVSAAGGNCAGGVQNCLFRLSASLPGGPYVWWIRAFSDAREGVWSRRGYFNEDLRPETVTSRYPAETEFTFEATRALTRPNYLNSVTDPLFLTRITRISDQAVFNAYGDEHGYTNYHPVQPYPKNQAWNSDGSYLRLNNTLLDGKTYEIVKDIEGHIYERKWAYTDPNTIYAIDAHGGEYSFVKQDVRNPEFANIEKLISFPQGDYDGLYIGPWEGNITFDDKLVALTAKKNNDLTVIVYNIQTDRIVSQKVFTDIWSRLDWVSVSPLGNYVLMNWEKDPQNPITDFQYSIDQYDINLNFIRELSQQGQHGDMGVNEEGQEVYVQFEFYGDIRDRRGIWLYSLDNGQETELLPDKYGGGHISCRNYKRPGWCYLSANGEGYKETIAFKLKIEAGDDYAKVNRFGQHHNQDLSAQGAPNPDGAKVVFKSNWGDSGAEADVYIAETIIPAFPGAEGGGAASKGGRGGQVYVVTNLNDSGPGSLRYGLEEVSGPRTIVFQVGGYIHLKSTINVVNDGFITIAGQTAPGDGITLTFMSNPNQSVLVFHNTHDIIMRYIRLRKGGAASDPQKGSGLVFSGTGYNIIVDHCSVSWTGGENIGLWSQDVTAGLKDLTVQWTIASEGLWNNHHATGLLSGSNTAPESMTNFSIHHNLFARNNNRNPLLKIASGDIINNIIYNWRWWATGIGGGIAVDIIGNKYKEGPAHYDDRPEISYKPYWENAPDPPQTGVNGNPSIFLAGNIGPHNSAPTADAWELMMTMTDLEHWEYPGGVQTDVPREFERTVQRASNFSITVASANLLESELLAAQGVGASRRLSADGSWVANRDEVDARVITDYENGAGATLLDNVDDITPAGGWPYYTNGHYAYVLEADFTANPGAYTLDPGTPYLDSDNDGMPDLWEDVHGLNKNEADDAILDGNGDGYDNLEEFLNGAKSRSWVSVTFLPLILK